MAFSKQEVIEIYRRRAGWYDVSANLYYLIGFREAAYRKKAVAALRLQPGETVVELGCGTGLNFSYLQEAIGPTGRIVGVDLTDQMLKAAQGRVLRNGWSNVELVCADASLYEFPQRVDGVLSTFALTLLPDYDAVIRRGSNALSQGGRFVILDFRKPENTPEWLLKLMLLITKPFGVTLDLAERHPWESVARYFSASEMREHFMGFVYVARGEAA